jgi:hypothetical protein
MKSCFVLRRRWFAPASRITSTQFVTLVCCFSSVFPLPINLWFDKKSYWRGGWIGLVVGPLVLAVTWMAGEGVRGTIAALLITAMVTMFSGFSGTSFARVSIEPNQAIARSLRHALFMRWYFSHLVVSTGGSF